VRTWNTYYQKYYELERKRILETNDKEVSNLKSQITKLDSACKKIESECDKREYSQYFRTKRLETLENLQKFVDEKLYRLRTAEILETDEVKKSHLNEIIVQMGAEKERFASEIKRLQNY
jgi:hypothetical protein